MSKNNKIFKLIERIEAVGSAPIDGDLKEEVLGYLKEQSRYKLFEREGPPKIDWGDCSGCLDAEWRDENTYDWNLSEGYWYCNRYNESLRSTWNDYGCRKCSECVEKDSKIKQGIREHIKDLQNRGQTDLSIGEIARCLDVDLELVVIVFEEDGLLNS